MKRILSCAFCLFLLFTLIQCKKENKRFDGQLTPPTNSAAFFKNKVAIIPGNTTYSTPALVYLPANYSTAKKYPLVLYCHSLHEAGTDLEKLYSSGLPKVLKGGYQPSFDFIMIAPLHATYSVDPRWFAAILEDVKKRLPIDEKRIYLTGYSAGGWGTYGSQLYIDTAIGKQFAAIVVCSGAVQNTTQENLDQWRTTKTPLWAVVGEDDPTYLAQNRYMVDEINKRVNGLAMLTVRPGVAHTGWDDVYSGGVKNGNKTMWEWIYQFRRM